MSSSRPDHSAEPVERSAEPVELFVIGRTLRGTLGDAFRAEAIARFESLHGTDSGGDGRSEVEADARTVQSGLSRTVDLTAVAVTRAGAVSVDAGVADPTFGSTTGSADSTTGESAFEVMVDELDGIRPIPGPPGVDLTRRAVVRVRPNAGGVPLAFRVHVLTRD
ncbi:hypothetical protein N1027_17250 [Herbiconiux sp. CPCC 205763]|uniref:Uncharacterized protein n=1 Tax=Herbiconiux aconitum TaxID=2970913 RepID=A0ABT2GUI7_9MICO|nr:hypothetical protein [Herbiconiux aconitum]MCS5719879.1 hypothetical protein [Herbiconiux aconitum]